MYINKFLLFSFFFNCIWMEENILGTPVVFFEDFIRELNLDFIMVVKNGDLGDKLFQKQHCLFFLFIISKALMIKGG